MLAKVLHTAFFGHPAAMGETYSQHCIAALLVALRLFAASLAACIHAFVPGVFQSTASSIAASVAEGVKRRKRVDVDVSHAKQGAVYRSTVAAAEPVVAFPCPCTPVCTCSPCYCSTDG